MYIEQLKADIQRQFSLVIITIKGLYDIEYINEIRKYLEELNMKLFHYEFENNISTKDLVIEIKDIKEFHDNIILFGELPNHIDKREIFTQNGFLYVRDLDKVEFVPDVTNNIIKYVIYRRKLENDRRRNHSQNRFNRKDKYS